MSLRLRDLVLTDLFVASDHVEYRERGGGNAPRLTVPDEYMDDVNAVRAKCAEIFTEHRAAQFSILHDQMMYRVGVMEDVDYHPIYVLNRAGITIPDVGSLGLSENILKLLRDPKASGFIAIGGPQRNGKSTSALAMTIYRITQTGVDGVVLQDPPEFNVAGKYGTGRLYVVPVDGVSGYSKAAQQAMRWGMNTFLFGEIRRRDVAGSTSNAAVALDMAESGGLVIGTQHGSSVEDTILRLIELAAEGMSSLDAARAAVAKSLSIVIYQRLEAVTFPGGKTVVRVEADVLDLTNDADSGAIRNVIRSGQLEQLKGLMQSQRDRSLFHAQRARG
jgi:Tfp pilus assembly pilus retraction ATPase PilT